MRSHVQANSFGSRSRWQTSVGAGMLALALGGRAAANAGFALWLSNVRPDRGAFFDGAITYLVVDGVIAIVASVILGSHVLEETPRLLGPATAADGVLRLIAAGALFLFPGLPDFPVTAVAFFGIIGGCAACLATIAVTIRLSVWRSRHRAHESTPLAMHEELDPVLIAGIVALAFVAYAFFAGPPATAAEYRVLGIRWGATLAVAFAIAAIGAAASAHRR